jgi:hypothetical protein
MKARKLIPLSAFVVAGTITLAEVHTNDRLPTINQWLGVAIAYLIMAIVADLGSDFGGAFAVLVMVTVLLTRGDEALAYATGKTGTAGKRKARKRKSDPGFGIIGTNVEVL